MRRAALKSSQWRAETWCSSSRRGMTGSGEKTASAYRWLWEVTHAWIHSSTAVIALVCVLCGHAGSCVTWALLRRAGSRLLISSRSLGNQNHASLSPAQVFKQTIPNEVRTDSYWKQHWPWNMCFLTEGSGSGNLSTSSSCSETYTSFSDIKPWTPQHFLASPHCRRERSHHPAVCAVLPTHRTLVGFPQKAVFFSVFKNHAHAPVLKMMCHTCAHVVDLIVVPLYSGFTRHATGSHLTV